MAWFWVVGGPQGPGWGKGCGDPSLPEPNFAWLFVPALLATALLVTALLASAALVSLLLVSLLLVSVLLAVPRFGVS